MMAWPGTCPAKNGSDIALIAIGNTVIPALRAAERLKQAGIDALVLNARFARPLDREAMTAIGERIPRIITVEENALAGGFGSSVIELMNEAELHPKVKRLGLPDRFIEQGTPAGLRRKYGLDEDGVYLAAVSLMREPIFSS